MNSNLFFLTRDAKFILLPVTEREILREPAPRGIEGRRMTREELISGTSVGFSCIGQEYEEKGFFNVIEKYSAVYFLRVLFHRLQINQEKDI